MHTLVTNNVSRVLLPKKPKGVTVKNVNGEVITAAKHLCEETSSTFGKVREQSRWNNHRNKMVITLFCVGQI